MKSATPAARVEHVLAIAAALLLPSISLIPLGGMYLWEKGWLLWWASAALAVVGLVTLVTRRIVFRAAKTVETGNDPIGAAPEATTGDGIDPRWSEVEIQAWNDVRAIARRIDIERITDTQSAWQVASETIDAVARRLHPGSHDAVWRFTLPEALAISERVSRRLAAFVVTHIPLSDRLTVSQVLAIYRARRVADLAGKAYDVWRLVRLVNPATAVTHEARERLTKAMYNWGREHVSRRITDAYVEEIGRAAIDLYGGRLRLASLSPTDQNAAAPTPDPAPGGGSVGARTMPPRRSAIGQVGSALGSLARAMTRRRP